MKVYGYNHKVSITAWNISHQDTDLKEIFENCGIINASRSIDTWHKSESMRYNLCKSGTTINFCLQSW